MGTRENNLWSSDIIADFDNIASDTIANVVILRRDAFTVWHTTFELSEVNHHVALLEATNKTRNDLASTVLEFIVEHFLLSHAETLHHGLFSCLHSDTVKVLWCDVEFKLFVDLNLWIFLLSERNGYFVEFVLDIIIGHDCKVCIDGGEAFLEIDVSSDLFNTISSRYHFAVCGYKSIFKGSDNSSAFELLLAFIVFNECYNIVSHGSGMGVL